MNDAAQTLDLASGRPLRVRSQTSVLGTTLNCRMCRKRTAGLARRPGCSTCGPLRLQHAGFECLQNCTRAVAHAHLCQNV